jgi:hypothetical protein
MTDQSKVGIRRPRPEIRVATNRDVPTLLINAECENLFALTYLTYLQPTAPDRATPTISGILMIHG